MTSTITPATTATAAQADIQAPEIPTGTPVEASAPAITLLLDEMPARRPVLLGILAFCATPRTEAEVAAQVGVLQARSSSVFDAASLCALLNRAGALALETAAGAPASTLDTAPELVREGGTSFLVVHATPELLWHTTPAGAAALAADDPVARLVATLSEETAYLPIYRQVLELCARSEGAGARELGEAIDDDPLLQEPRLFVQHFLERLEAAEALSWDGTWHITELGQAALDTLGAAGCDAGADGQGAGSFDADALRRACEQAQTARQAHTADSAQALAGMQIPGSATGTAGSSPAEGTPGGADPTSVAGVSDTVGTPATSGPAPAPDPTTLAGAMSLRGATYALLARLFRTEADQALLDQLHSLRFPTETGSDEIDEGYRLIASYLGGAHPGMLTELAVDYVRTFIGHGVDARSAAYPYESAYASDRHLLMQEARDEVLALYRAAGLERSDDWREGEDHIACELEYLAALAGRTAQRLDTGDEDAAERLLVSQLAFLDDHLLTWAPQMAADMLGFAQTDLYRGLAHLTRGYLAADRELLSELLA